MAIRVAVYRMLGHKRSIITMSAMCHGVERSGDKWDLLDPWRYDKPTHDVAVFYGFIGSLPKIMADYKALGRKVVFVDLGYWGRREGGTVRGYHKIVVNDRHPTAYFRRRRHDPARFKHFGIEIKGWRKNNGHVLLAGMGPKAANVIGMGSQEWELATIEKLRLHTDRPIVYRPKPSWKCAKQIPGTIYSPPDQLLEKVLLTAHAVVTRHSNTAVDGLLEGIPAFCEDGVAKPMALHDLSRIESPRYPQGREQWAADIAWTQFTVTEMAEGLPWRHFKDEGLIP